MMPHLWVALFLEMLAFLNAESAKAAFSGLSPRGFAVSSEVFGLMDFWLQFKVRFSPEVAPSIPRVERLFPHFGLLKNRSYEARNGLGCAPENRTVELSKKT